MLTANDSVEGITLIHSPIMLGKPLSEEDNVTRLQADVEFLWSLLDDIDTASDMAKDNDKWYRTKVEVIQSKRHQRVTSDGYSLFVVPI